MTLTVNGQPAEPGCYVEGHWGQYGADHLADQLERFGIVIPKLDDPRRYRRIATSHEENGAQGTAARYWERHAETYDELIDLANEATSEGGYWEWYDGECFLRSYVCPECGRVANDDDDAKEIEPCDYCCDADDPGVFA